MNDHLLHWIAEQLHAGVGMKKVDFGAADLEEAGVKRELMVRALRAYPTAASLWHGSNEVVLPSQAAPSNIQPFNRFPSVSAKVPKHLRSTATKGTRPGSELKAPGLMVHWRLKTATRRQKHRLYLDLRWRAESLQNAYQDFREGNGGWDAVEQVHLEYIDTIRDANAFVSAVWDDQEKYYWTRSKSWQNSEAAWAYRVWMDAWEPEIPAPSLPSRTGGLDLDLNSWKLLWAYPDEPAK